MSRRVRLEPEAEEELHAAAAHYDGQVSGLGRDFIAAASAAARRLRSWPHSGPFVDGVDQTLQVRRVPIPRFPYQLIYVQSGSDVHVIAVAHDARRPGYWSARIPE